MLQATRSVEFGVIVSPSVLYDCAADNDMLTKGTMCGFQRINPCSRVVVCKNDNVDFDTRRREKQLGDDSKET